MGKHVARITALGLTLAASAALAAPGVASADTSPTLGGSCESTLQQGSSSGLTLDAGAPLNAPNQLTVGLDSSSRNTDGSAPLLTLPLGDTVKALGIGQVPLVGDGHVQARGAHLIVAKTPRIGDDSVDPRVKNFHWGDMTRALFEAQDQGAESCVLLDREGFVTEGPGFNVFAVTDGAVATPDRGALEGITRLSVAELCEDLRLPFAARPVTAAELRDADEIFLSTTAGGIMPVSRLDARILGNDRPGPISSLLRETFWAKRAHGWHATPIDYELASAA